MIANHKIPDPYYRDNERSLQWIGEKDWDYQTMLVATGAMLARDRVELVFAGLDTYADVYINGRKVIQANNMHREWRVDCKKVLHMGDNQLLIHFNSVFKVDIPKYLAAPYKLQAFLNNDQGDMWLSVYARKAGYEYGWDWGPRLLSCGVWRPAYIESWDGAKINNVQVLQEQVSKQLAKLNTVWEVRSSEPKDATLVITEQGKTIATKKVKLDTGINKLNLSFNITKPRLWWPNGLGEPNLYTFTYALKMGASVLDAKTVRTGIRTLKVVRQADKDGKSFFVQVNGVPVFIKGSNYIPNDNFPNRVTAQRYQEVIQSAKDAHMNMLRVWGGGFYENNIFYDLCDQKGILVWQDLMFACGMFPSDSGFVNNVKQEVKENITRLRNHPSIALWCGNNENEIAWYRWGWKNKYSPEIQKQYEASMLQLFHVTIPGVIDGVDTTHYYHTSSPNAVFNDITKGMGDSHYYGVWMSGDPFAAYDRNVARFMSEYGFQSFPDINTIEKFTEPVDRESTSSIMLAHQRAKDNDTRNDYGTKNIKRYMEMYYKDPKDFKSFIYVSQLLQAKGIRTAIEAHRRNMPYCMGTMYWQLNDCWPVASWSSTDYYGHWKALHYAVKKAYQKEIISVTSKNDQLKVYVATDRLDAINPILDLKLLDFDGNVLYMAKQPVKLSANTSAVYFETLKSSLLKKHSLNDVVLSVNLINQKDTLADKNYYFAEEKDLALKPANVLTTITDTKNGYAVIVKTDKLVKNLYLNFPGQDVIFSNNYFDLLPGETKSITLQLKGGKALDKKGLVTMSLINSYDKLNQ